LLLCLCCSPLAQDAVQTRSTLEFCKAVASPPETAPPTPPGGSVPSSPATVAELALNFGGTTPQGSGQVCKTLNPNVRPRIMHRQLVQA
jgi:hypothetical protein